MEFYDVIARRRSIRDFSEKAVDEAVLRKVLEAGLKAPSSNHLRQWEFILIKDERVRHQIIHAENLDVEVDLNELQELFKGMDAVAREMYLEAIPKQKRMLLEAPELLIVCFKFKPKLRECTRVYDLNSFASIWCCIENLLLALTAEGLAGVTYIPEETDMLKEVLNIPPDYEIPAIIPIGYPAETAEQVAQKEATLKERLHTNRWKKTK